MCGSAEKIQIYGLPGDYSGSYSDDGSHYGHTLKPCPFCGEKDNLELSNITSTAVFWIECCCGASMKGEYHETASLMRTEAEALSEYEKAMQSVVNDWNTRK
ncbi:MULTISPECIES: Lar family restriction alleviation protein [Leclercia]|uniref:Lar family restriction alleviation protein n=1 Tax=Leclercia adecarboxylata TaxID=83655 RepID=A0ABU6IBS8_9ENTR|nr:MULTISPECIES: Lar family restriction alleviation protein [Leclercia]MCG1034567.1 Lar family restriction alleviation protein [Bacillus amyloliquefaciens]MDU5385662.1 Lar family restriction alleviation protein [Blautia producta]AXF67333.1 hypothetical protein DVA44_25160 [Leclercia sp. W17]MBW9398665.1 hypothetical protein [Leclercia sp. EC_58]MDH0064482.1 Lar family restriction alleviation protein [Leclercia adecarboxylata]